MSGPVLYDGLLEKKGAVPKILLSIKKDGLIWQARHFVMTARHLAWYKPAGAMRSPHPP